VSSCPKGGVHRTNLKGPKSLSMLPMPSDGRFETIEVGNLGKDGKHFRSWLARHLFIMPVERADVDLHQIPVGAHFSEPDARGLSTLAVCVDLRRRPIARVSARRRLYRRVR
jgi:hypothetical protein